MHVQTTLSWHYIPTRIAKIKKKKKRRTKCCPVDAEELGVSYVVGGNVKWYSLCAEQFVVSCKTERELTSWPIRYTLGRLLQRNETYVLVKTCMWTVTVALLVIAKSWKTTQIALRGWINCGTSIAWSVLLSNADKRCWYAKQLGWSQGPHTEWKKAHLKRLHTVWFHLHKILFIVVKIQNWPSQLFLQFSSVKLHSHRCGADLQNFFILKNWNCLPIEQLSPSPSLLPLACNHHFTFCFCEFNNFASCQWNHAAFVFFWLAYSLGVMS